MALLFTVVLSACPSRIGRRHNPLFIPAEPRVCVCKWTRVMADRERLTSPPVRLSREASKTYNACMYNHSLIYNREAFTLLTTTSLYDLNKWFLTQQKHDAEKWLHCPTRRTFLFTPKKALLLSCYVTWSFFSLLEMTSPFFAFFMICHLVKPLRSSQASRLPAQWWGLESSSKVIYYFF